MNALDGTLGTQLASADVASGDLNSVMVNDQFTYKGKHYVVAGPAFTNGKFYMLDVTDPANATLVHELGPIGNNTNGNNTGGVVFDDATEDSTSWIPTMLLLHTACLTLWICP